MASLISGAMNSAAWTGAGMIPVFVVGLAYLRYSMYDPESRVVDVQEVNTTFIYSLDSIHLRPYPMSSRLMRSTITFVHSGLVVLQGDRNILYTGCTNSLHISCMYTVLHHQLLSGCVSVSGIATALSLRSTSKF